MIDCSYNIACEILEKKGIVNPNSPEFKIVNRHGLTVFYMGERKVASYSEENGLFINLRRV